MSLAETVDSEPAASVRVTDLATYWSAENTDNRYDSKKDALSGYLPTLGGREDDFYADMTRAEELERRLDTVEHNLMVYLESIEDELVDEDIYDRAQDVITSYEPVMDVNNELGRIRERFGVSRFEVVERLEDDIREYAERKRDQLSDTGPEAKKAEEWIEYDWLGARVDLLVPGDRIVEAKTGKPRPRDEFQAAAYRFGHALETGETLEAEVLYLPHLRTVPVRIGNDEVAFTFNQMQSDIAALQSIAGERIEERFEQEGISYGKSGSPEEMAREAVDRGEVSRSRAAELLEQEGEAALEQLLEDDD
ncbi:MAG: hypothetical protein ABEI58_01160 [Candidatus Nanohaloarchaea archaeon]